MHVVSETEETAEINSPLPGMLNTQNSADSGLAGRDSVTSIITPIEGFESESDPGEQDHRASQSSFSMLSDSINDESNLFQSSTTPKATHFKLSPEVCDNWRNSMNSKRSSSNFMVSRMSSDLSERGSAKEVELLSVWKNRANRNKMIVHGAYRSQTRFMRNSNQFTMRDVAEQESCLLRNWRKLVVSPGTSKRFFWDFLSLLLVIYDMGSIPLSLLDPPENVVTDVMEWVTRIFWTFDIPTSFLTGYMAADASHIMHPYKIARNYMRGWFSLDMALVLMDWVELIWGSMVEDASKYGRVGKAGRIFRILRMVRLLRLVRMRSIIHIITTRVRSEKVVIFIDIIKIFLALVSLSHVIACIWYGIGNSSGDETWLKKFDIMHLDLVHRYMMALHWSLAQFQGGMDEFVPTNFRERFFAVVVFVFAWLTAAFFVSLLTSSMTRLHILSSHQSRQLNVLQKFLKQNAISDRLALRVHRNATHSLTEKQRLMPEHEVELLTMVSEPLRVEIHFEMYSPVLEVHPFFAQYVYECPQVMRKVCHLAMSMLLVSTGDVVFNAGEAPAHPKFYIACSGVFEYLPFNGEKQEVLEEDWLSEAALWSKWVHHGTLKSLCDGRLAVLDARSFQDIVGQFEHSIYDPKSYAMQYVQHLREMMDNGESLTDMHLCGYEGTIAKTLLESHSHFRESRFSVNYGSTSSHLVSKRKRSVFIGNATSESKKQAVLESQRTKNLSKQQGTSTSESLK